MDKFTNETIDTNHLPRYEEVPFTPLHAKYKSVVLLNVSIFTCVTLVGALIYASFNHDVVTPTIWTFISIGLLVLLGLVYFFALLGLKKKGFAFRNHDVLYRSGIIATSTMVIPYNRIQHVALHEGLISRYFGLAKVEIFTAGGSASDIKIPGIAKPHAEDIKQLLMGKIQKQL
jgi:membrane protein YdbS with pleckstrin-like domain